MSIKVQELENGVVMEACVKGVRERTEFKAGIYEVMPSERYHSVDAASSTGLNALSQSPAHYLASLQEPPKRTPALLFGCAVHTAILEPYDFANNYILEPIDPDTGEGVDRRCKAGKLAWETLAIEHPDANVLTLEDWTKIQGMTEAIRAHKGTPDQPGASILLDPDGGYAERSYFWMDKELNVPLKCRPDREPSNVKHHGSLLVDLKTTTDARYDNFYHSCIKFGYDRQSAIYLDGTGAEEFYFVVVEKEPPYGIMVYEAIDDFVECGRRDYRRLLEIYAECRRTNVWPTYQSTHYLLMNSARLERQMGS